MRWLAKGRCRLFGGQRGFSLIEVLVAVGILGFIGAVAGGHDCRCQYGLDSGWCHYHFVADKIVNVV